jgi:hypothetical protein
MQHFRHETFEMPRPSAEKKKVPIFFQKTREKLTLKPMRTYEKRRNRSETGAASASNAVLGGPRSSLNSSVGGF